MQEITTLPRPQLSKDVRDRLMKPAKQTGRQSKILAEATKNPSVENGQYTSSPWQNGNGNGSHEKKGSARRYFATVEDTEDWPPELHDYNQRFAQTLNHIKRRHDSVVTTVA